MENDEDIFIDIIFNRDEIMGTDETFFNNENNNNNMDYSLDLEKSDNSVSSDKLDLCDKSMEEEMRKVRINDNEDKNLKKNKHKIAKKDLNTIPIPIFECLYCANEKIVFNHLINEKLSLKYLYNTEKKDISLLNFLIKNNLFIESEEKLKQLFKAESGDINNYFEINKLKKILSIILDNKEYLNRYYHINESHNFLKQKRERENYNFNLINKNKKKLKEIKRINHYIIQKNEQSSNDSNSNDNSNSIDNYKRINIITKNIIENENRNKDIIKLDEKEEEKICNIFNKLLDDEDEFFVDLRRKIKWDDIEFEDKPYNIWEPNSIDDGIIETDSF